MRGRSERPDDVTLSAVLNEVHPSHSQSRFETMPRFDFDCCVSFQSLWVGVECPVRMYPFLHSFSLSASLFCRHRRLLLSHGFVNDAPQHDAAQEADRG